jgi:hypothetical protein
MACRAGVGIIEASSIMMSWLEVVANMLRSCLGIWKPDGYVVLTIIGQEVPLNAGVTKSATYHSIDCPQVSEAPCSRHM